jgi:hypothetical protein
MDYQTLLIYFVAAIAVYYFFIYKSSEHLTPLESAPRVGIPIEEVSADGHVFMKRPRNPFGLPRPRNPFGLPRPK